MKYILSNLLEIFCSENFYISKLNSKFDYINNNIIPFNTSEKFNLDDFSFISESDVEKIRSIYHNTTCQLLDEDKMNWIIKFKSDAKNIDFSNEEDIKLISYHVNLLLELLHFPSKLIKSFNYLFLKNIFTLNNATDIENYYNTVISNIDNFLNLKEFWFIELPHYYDKEYKLLHSVAEQINKNQLIDYDLIESSYFEILDSGVIKYTYDFNSSDNCFSKKLSLEQQYNYLVQFNTYILNKIQNDIIDDYDFNIEKITSFKAINTRLDRILKLKLKDWMDNE